MIVTEALGITANATYAVANKLPNLFGIVQSTFNLAWQENASMSVDDDSAIYYGRMFSSIYKMLVGIMALLVSFTPILFPLLIKGNYEKAYIQMPILFIAALFSSISSYLGGIYVAHKKSKEIGITTMLAAGLNVIIDLLFVNKIGIFAASISTVISYFVLVIYRMIDIQKIEKIKFDVKLLCFGISVLSIMCVLCSVQNYIVDIVNFCIAIIISLSLNFELIKSILVKLGSKIKNGK